MSFRRYVYKPLILIVFMAVTAVFMPNSARSTFISPPRVIIDAGKTAGEMLILNRGTVTRIYTLKWEDRAMFENTKIATGEDLKKVSGYRPASPHLVYSPRQVILEPGASQRIRFFVKRKNMTDGEYRSHILISGQPVQEREKQELKGGLGGSIAVVPQAGIPVMVRHGKTKVEIEPQLFELIKVDGRDHLHAKFINKSTRTLYAKPTLICERPGLDEPELIEALSIRMYYEGKYFDENLYLRSDEPNLEGCTSIKMQLTDKLDFQYKHKPFYTQILK